MAFTVPCPGVREWGGRVFLFRPYWTVTLVTYNRIASLSLHAGWVSDSVAERHHHCLTCLTVNLYKTLETRVKWSYRASPRPDNTEPCKPAVTPCWEAGERLQGGCNSPKDPRVPSSTPSSAKTLVQQRGEAWWG